MSVSISSTWDSFWCYLCRLFNQTTCLSNKPSCWLLKMSAYYINNKEAFEGLLWSATGSNWLNIIVFFENWQFYWLSNNRKKTNRKKKEWHTSDKLSTYIVARRKTRLRHAKQIDKTNQKNVHFSNQSMKYDSVLLYYYLIRIRSSARQGQKVKQKEELNRAKGARESRDKEKRNV